MCKQCEIKPVYEFTNQRKLCNLCFIKYFQKKVLYTIRKFGMIQMGDTVSLRSWHKNLSRGIVGYRKAPLGVPQNSEFGGNDFRDVVLEDVLKVFAGKGNVELVRLPAHLHSQVNRGVINSKKLGVNGTSVKRLGETSRRVVNNRAKRDKLLNKIAISSTLDQEADEIVHEIIKGNIKKLNVKPVEKKIIKPLYLFLDEEVLLYAKLRNAGAKFEKNKETPLPTGIPKEGTRTSSRPQNTKCRGKDEIGEFINELEKKHPEIKRAIVNGWLKLYC